MSEAGLAGKVAIVTGASSKGIGGAIARRLARAGAALFLASTEDDGDRTELDRSRIDVTHRLDTVDEGGRQPELGKWHSW